MKLGEYLKKHKITQAAFAFDLNCDQARISDMVTGKVEPRFATMDAIKKLTKGQVDYADWAPKPKRKR